MSNKKELFKQLKVLEEKKQSQDFYDVPLQEKIADIVRELDKNHKGWQKHA